MKFDRTTVVLGTLALASIGFAQRAWGQATINCGGSSEPAIGATCLVSNNVSVAVPSVARLTIDATSTTLTPPQASEFAPGGTGHSDPAGPTLTVAANVNWTVTASAGAALWTGGSGTKPSTDLTITNDGGATYHALSFAVNTGTPTSSSAKQVGYHTNYAFTVDTPGTYSLVVNYTLTSP